jgi:membrane protein
MTTQDATETVHVAAQDSKAPASHRGRNAKEPKDIPPRCWWDITWRVIKRLGTDNVTLVSGGLAMYTLLSVFPGLTAALSIYGLFASPETVIQQMKAFSGVLPPGVWNIFNTQLQTLAGHQNSTLSIAAAISLIIALWSARSAMSALMTATNIAYGEREKRNYFVQILVSLALTIGAVSAFLLMLTLGVAVPVALKVLGTRPWVQWIVDGLQWALVWAFAVLGLSVIYRYGPAREPARWHWITWGSGIAAALWLAASALFALYVGDFANYGKTYGALGGVIALLMWFYLSSIIVVLGAEINAEMERQTVKDTTEGAPAPLGQRGAYAADTVGPQANEAGNNDQERGIEGR